MSYVKTNWQNGVTPINETNLNKMEDGIETTNSDSGWITATPTSDFQNYDNISANAPKYRKLNNVVEIRGALQPTRTITASSTATVMFSLPSGYRPSETNRYYICQGSGRNVWTLTVYADGDVGVSRYGTSSSVDIPTTAWLPFNAMFTI